MIDFNSGSHSPGYYGWIVFIVFCAILLIGSIVILVIDDEGPGFGIGALIVTAVIFTAGAVAYYPFSGDFHKYYTVSGTVAEKPASRILPSGESVSQRFVIRFKESGELFGVDDTRASTVKAGDKVTLRCKREFEFNSVPGWGCKWNTK